MQARDIKFVPSSFWDLILLVLCRNPPGFGFIVYKRAEDAERAVREIHGGYDDCFALIV
jgi:RNA recognition motif. (a.k.a. RRM, RBD, or RNP domain)